MFSHGSQQQSPDVPLESYREFELRQAEFFLFLDKELDKIERFYRSKENEASVRLEALKEQLHEMRNRRIEEVATHKDPPKVNGDPQQDRFPDWIKPIENAMRLRNKFGKNAKVHEMPTEHRREDWGDFSRRPHHDQVPYRVAKRKLKVALQEFYRGLELLKSYALLNRTAFRKINKKYDKAVQARPTGRYMSETVNNAWFVQSEVLDGQLVAVEDLYARYFERGNHKIAVNKLRTKHVKDGHSSSVFRNGLFLAAGTVLGIQGIVYGAQQLANEYELIRLQTSFLLQV